MEDLGPGGNLERQVVGWIVYLITCERLEPRRMTTSHEGSVNEICSGI